MARRKAVVLASERHRIRVVQQVAAGTPGAVVDAIFGSSWVTRWLDKPGGPSGWISAEMAPMLNDASEVSLVIPPTGPDGRDAGDVFYFLAGSVDPTNPTGARAPYFPGDEWFEIYRMPDDLLALATPINATLKPDTITVTTRDVLQVLKKIRETSAGFWCNAPRDVFEHYSRVWRAILNEDFPTSVAQFPATRGSGTTPDGKWTYTNAQAGGASFVTLTPAAATYEVDSITSPGGGASGQMAFTWAGRTWTTGAFTRTATAAQVATAVQAATSTGGITLPASSVVASGGPLGTAAVVLTFQGSMIGPVTAMTGVGGLNPLTVTRTTQGSGSNCELLSTKTWADAGVNDHSCWRAEARVSAVQVSINSSSALLGLTVKTSPGGVVVASMLLSPNVNNPADPGNLTLLTTVGGATKTWPVTAVLISDPNNHLTPPYTFAIEARDRWVYFYLDGQLVGSAPRAAAGTVTAAVDLNGVYPGDTATVDYVVVRTTTAPLNGGVAGDYVLPSSPASGGLTGEYFDLYGADTPTTQTILSNVLTGGRRLAERIDPLGGPSYGAIPPAWQYAGLSGAFLVRWTGAIYLPLASQDVTFALPSGVANTTDMMRLYVGKTRAGENILTNWTGDTVVSTSVGMRSLFGSVSGWYPIICEYYWAPLANDFGGHHNVNPVAWTSNSNPFFTYNVGGAGTIPPSSVLAPLGVHRTKVNAGDSHYDTLKSMVDEIGYQWRSIPQTLESGYFPGSIVPRVRVGRDTDYTLTVEEAVDPQVLVASEDVANALMAAAQGLGGSSSGTLSAEAFNFAGMLQHPFLSQEYENMPSTTVGAQFVMTLLSLLGYRSASWEDVQVASGAGRQMQDSFPLTGALAEFDWQPGDGVRVQIPSVFVNDVTPRQILSLRRLLRPDGVGENHASFRPRNRSFEQTLRKFMRQVYGQQRTFQGQIVQVQGTRAVGGSYSELVFPTDGSTIRQVNLTVLTKSDTTTTYDVEINGSVPTGYAALVTTPSIIPITQQVARNVNRVLEPRMVVRLVNPSAGGSQVSYQLSALVLVPTL